MKTLTLLLGSSLILAHAHAQSAAPAEAKPADAPPAPKHFVLKYTPPKDLATGKRIDGDGGSRAGGKLPKLWVLAPNGPATTTSEHPSLFWYQATPMPEQFLKTARVEITLLDPKQPKPLVKVSSPLSGDNQGGAGIRRLVLSKQKVTLEPGVTYKWTVALVPDPANRSQDEIFSAGIVRVPVSKELETALKNAAPGERAAVYAQNGVWYDAVEAITAEIDKSPQDPGLHKMRAELLSANGLKDAAAYDKK